MDDERACVATFVDEFERVRRELSISLTDLARLAGVPPAFVKGLSTGKVPPLYVDGGTLLADRDPRYLAVFTVLGITNHSITSLVVHQQHEEGQQEVLPLQYRLWDAYSALISRHNLLAFHHEDFRVFFFQLWDLWIKAAHIRKFAELKMDTLRNLGGSGRILRLGARKLGRVLRDTQILSREDTHAFCTLLLMFTQP